MGLFGKKQDDGVKMIFGSDGKSHMAFTSGNMTFVDGQMYASVGDNMAVGTNVNTYFSAGNAVFGSDGSTHMKFGDNPTFLL